MQTIDNSRGTPLWSVNRLRSDLLVGFLDDLLVQESVGLADDHCRQVKIALGQMTNAAAAMPDHSFWRGPIWKDLEKFEDIYAEWNSHQGPDPVVIQARRRALRKLRGRRHKLAHRVRRSQFVLQNELDLKLVSDLYAAMGSLSKALPEVFVNVSRILAKLQ